MQEGRSQEKAGNSRSQIQQNEEEQTTLQNVKNKKCQEQVLVQLEEKRQQIQNRDNKHHQIGDEDNVVDTHQNSTTQFNQDDVQEEEQEDKEKALKNSQPISNHPKFSHATLEQIREELEKFAVERNWNQFHTPRNLLLALMGEVGELAEEFQWKGEVSPGLPGLSPREKIAVQEEVADVMLYLVRFADICGIDLSSAVFEKIQKNEKKYPSHLCRGSSAKYTAYEATPEVQQTTEQQEAPTVLPIIEEGGGSPTAGNKRKRFTDEQVQQMRNLALKANWSMASLSKQEKEQFCNKWNIPRDKLQNFFNNRKPKGLKRAVKAFEGQDVEDVQQQHEIGVEETSKIHFNEIENVDDNK